MRMMSENDRNLEIARADAEGLASLLKQSEQRATKLADALRDEVLMAEQSQKTLRMMRAGWRELTVEDENGPLIEGFLDALIEDVSPDQARAALRRYEQSQGKP